MHSGSLNIQTGGSASFGGLSGSPADNAALAAALAAKTAKAGDTLTGALVLNMPSGFTGKIWDAKVDGTSKASVDQIGSLILGQSGVDNGVSCRLNGNDRFGAITLHTFGNGVAVSNGCLGVTQDEGRVDLYNGNATVNYGSIRGIEPGHLGFLQVSGVNPQKVSVFHRFTDTANYQAAAIKTGSDYVEFAAETAGTGADNVDVRVTPTGTGVLKLPVTGMVIGLGAIADAGSGQLTLGVGQHYAAFGAFIAAGGLIVSSGGLGTGNAFTLRPSANGPHVVEQRNGVNGQEYRVFGTYTDDSNRRYLAIRGSTGGVFVIKPEGDGTGASGNVLHISGLPTSNPGPGVLWNNAGTPAIGT